MDTPPQITADVQTGTQPGTITQQATLTASATHEYVAGGKRGWYSAAAEALPRAIDDLTAELGDDLYERMLRDPQVIASVNIFKASILDTGARLASARPTPDQPGHARAGRLAEFCQAQIAALDCFDEVMWNLLDALALGYKVAEQVYELRDGRLTLARLKVKPRHSLAFVVDPYKNVLGLLATIPGVAEQARSGLLAGLIGEQANLLPRSKFAILTFRPQDSDPRGASILRPAYNAWWLKMQCWPEYLKFLAQFAGPSVIGTTAPDARGDFDYDGTNQPIPGSWRTAEDRLLDALLALRNGTALALPNGSSVAPLAVDYAAGGTAFETAIAILDKQITTAILHQTLATQESTYGTRAQASVHQDALTMVLNQAKRAVERMIRRDILAPLVRLNFGDAAVPLTPTVSLGETEQRDVTALMTAIAALATVGWITPSQQPAIDTLLGLPQRTPEEIAIATRLLQTASAATTPAEATPSTPTFQQGDAAIVLADHMPGMQGTRVTIAEVQNGPYYATQSGPGQPLHKWYAQNELQPTASGDAQPPDQAAAMPM